MTTSRRYFRDVISDPKWQFLFGDVDTGRLTAPIDGVGWYGDQMDWQRSEDDLLDEFLPHISQLLFDELNNYNKVVVHRTGPHSLRSSVNRYKRTWETFCKGFTIDHFTAGHRSDNYVMGFEDGVYISSLLGLTKDNLRVGLQCGQLILLTQQPERTWNEEIIRLSHDVFEKIGISGISNRVDWKELVLQRCSRGEVAGRVVSDFDYYHLAIEFFGPRNVLEDAAQKAGCETTSE